MPVPLQLPFEACEKSNSAAASGYPATANEELLQELQPRRDLVAIPKNTRWAVLQLGEEHDSTAAAALGSGACEAGETVAAHVPRTALLLVATEARHAWRPGSRIRERFRLPVAAAPHVL